MKLNLKFLNYVLFRWIYVFFGVKEDKESSKTNEITVESITTAVINGNTYYYITDTNKNRYYASVEVAKYKLPFLKNGDVVTITYNELSDINKISKLK